MCILIQGEVRLAKRKKTHGLLRTIAAKLLEIMIKIIEIRKLMIEDRKMNHKHQG